MSSQRQRQSLRLAGYDYAAAGYYFVTVCVQRRECLLGEIVDGLIVMNDAGRMVDHWWNELPDKFTAVALDYYVVMPNHFHGIIIINNRRGEPCVRPYIEHEHERNNRRGESCIRPHIEHERNNEGEHKVQGEHKVRPYGTLDGTVGRVIQAFKSLTTNAYIQGVKNHNWPPFPGKLWQRNYYERIIRNDEELHNIRQYIDNNPVNWTTDSENPLHHRQIEP